MLQEIVTTIQEKCPEGESVYLAAPTYGHVPFLAGRPGLAPYPSALLAATKSERDEMLGVLKQARPQVVLLTRMGIDVPFKIEHPQESRFIEEHYELYKEIGDLFIYTLKQ